MDGILTHTQGLETTDGCQPEGASLQDKMNNELPTGLGASEEMNAILTHPQGLETTDRCQPDGASLQDKMNVKSYRPPINACIFDGRLMKLEDIDKQRLKDNCTIEIGKGGFGIVYTSERVLDGFGIRVALKKIQADTSENSKSARREMMASRIMHPFTLPLLAVLELENSEFWFISPYCENGDLHVAIGRDVEHKNNIQLTRVIRIRILLQISLAIQYLHTAIPNVREVILHKDISSKNVVLDESFNARLIDFGLAREIGDQTTNAHGKMLYLHPDVGQKPACENWDYYSFGVVIREVLTGLEPKGIAYKYLKFMSQDEVLKHRKHQDIWSESSYFSSLNEIADTCLEKKEHKLEFSTIVIQKLKSIHKSSNVNDTYDEGSAVNKQCHICMINPQASDTSLIQAHASNCTQKICVCIACVKNSFLNPITCYCGTELKPSIGHGWGALLIAGNDTKNKNIAEAIRKDVIEIKNVITSKAPLIMGISEDKVRMVVPSNPGTPEKLLPKMEEAIKQFSNDTDITTLLIYISCHGEREDKHRLKLGSDTCTISMDDFKTSLETLKNIERVLLFLDCCYPSMIHLNNKKYIQINACEGNQEALVDDTGSRFTRYLIRGLKASSEKPTKCTYECKHCKAYWDNRTDFVSVQSLFDYIKNHMKNIDPTLCYKSDGDFSNIAFYTDEELLIRFTNVSGRKDSPPKPDQTVRVQLEYFQKMKQLEDKLLETFQKDERTYTVQIQKDTYRKDPPLEKCDTLEKVISAWVHRQPLQVAFSIRSAHTDV